MTNPTWRTPFEQALAEGRVPGFRSPAFPGRESPLNTDFTLRVGSPSSNLGIGQRGLVLAAPVIFHEDGRFSTTKYDRHHLQAALLFWDALEYPSNSALEIGEPDLESLVALGALNRTRVVVRGRISAGVLSDAHLAAFEALDAASPGRWSLGRLPNSGSFPASELIDNGGLSIKLANAIPLPGRDVPFEDLLDFRARRKPELLALRAHLDQIGQVISTAPDTERALVAAIDELDRAVRDQVRVTSERFGISRIIDLDAGFNIADAARSSIPAIFAALAGGLPLTTATLIGLGTGAIVSGVSAELRPGRRKSKGSSPFEYVVELNREFG